MDCAGIANIKVVGANAKEGGLGCEPARHSTRRKEREHIADVEAWSVTDRVTVWKSTRWRG